MDFLSLQQLISLLLHRLLRSLTPSSALHLLLCSVVVFLRTKTNPLREDATAARFRIEGYDSSQIKEIPGAGLRSRK
ncbi:hypothetical protein L1887_36206 [Cichorium endivia]|nr:hypothetical protein L1887_36206 [Cichorium endivia]